MNLNQVTAIAKQTVRRHRRRHLVLPTMVAAKTIRSLLVDSPAAHFISPAAKMLRVANGQLGTPGAHAWADQLKIRSRAAEVRATTTSLRQMSQQFFRNLINKPCSI